MNLLKGLFDSRSPEVPIAEAAETFGDTHNQIVVVDFNRLAHFADNDLAHTCIVVPVSNGEKGTISHLTVNMDPVVYAQELAQYWRDERPPVIPIGGDRSGNHITTSEQFLDTLIHELAVQGFPVVPVSDMLLGATDYLRNVVIFPNEVRVSTTDMSGNNEKIDHVPFKLEG